MMKNSILLITLALTLFVVSSHTTNAQERRLSSSPSIFQAFYSSFKNAVQKSNKAGIASMTYFPFMYGFDAGDEGKMSKTQFVKRFNEIFGKSPRHFFTEKNPVFSIVDGGTYVVSTEDAAHLSFVMRGNTFKFAAYFVEP